MGADDLLPFRPAGDEGINFVDASVVYCNTESLAFEVEYKVLPHYCEADQSDGCFHDNSPLDASFCDDTSHFI